MAISEQEQVSLRVAAGDIRALAELYDRHAHVAWGAALDRVAAEAAVDAAFLKLWRRPEPSDPRSLGVRVLAAFRAQALQVRPT